MAQYKTITHRTGKGETKKTVSIKYRIDSEFIPTEIKEICMDFIYNYCVDNGESSWLKKEVNQTITDKNGKKRDYPFVSLRADFVNKFFPAIVKGEDKTESWKARINAL